MRLGTIIFIILVIGFAITAIAIITQDFNVNYPEAGVDTSFLGNFNYYSKINESMGNIQTDLDNVANAKSGWTQLGGLFLVFFTGVFTTIKVIMLSVPMLGSMITSTGVYLGINSTIIAFAYLGLISAIIIMLIKFLNKNPQGT